MLVAFTMKDGEFEGIKDEIGTYIANQLRGRGAETLGSMLLGLQGTL